MIYWKQTARLIEPNLQKQEVFINFVDKLIDFSFSNYVGDKDCNQVIKPLLQILSKGIVDYEDYMQILEVAPYLGRNGAYGINKDNFKLSGRMQINDFILYSTQLLSSYDGE